MVAFISTLAGPSICLVQLAPLVNVYALCWTGPGRRAREVDPLAVAGGRGAYRLSQSQSHRHLAHI